MNIPAGNHNGGDLHIGNDGDLYVSVGDGGTNPRGAAGGSAAQDLSLLNGKILRITTTGGVPADNPFVGQPGRAVSARWPGIGAPTTAKCTEIYDYGLRNPYRFAFDPNTTRHAVLHQRRRREHVGGGRRRRQRAQLRLGHARGLLRQRLARRTARPTPAGFTDPLTVYNHTTGCTFITAGAFIPNGDLGRPVRRRLPVRRRRLREDLPAHERRARSTTRSPFATTTGTHRRHGVPHPGRPDRAVLRHQRVQPAAPDHGPGPAADHPPGVDRNHADDAHHPDHAGHPADHDDRRRPLKGGGRLRPSPSAGCSRRPRARGSPPPLPCPSGRDGCARAPGHHEARHVRAGRVQGPSDPRGPPDWTLRVEHVSPKVGSTRAVKLLETISVGWEATPRASPTARAGAFSRPAGRSLLRIQCELHRHLWRAFPCSAC